METNRRDFFRTVGTATAAGLWGAPRASDAAVAVEKYVPAPRHALAFAGGATDEVLAVEGGKIRGEWVSTAPSSATGVAKKHITNIAIEDFTISIGPSQSPDMYVWIKSMVGRNIPLRNGSVLAADAAGNPRSRVDFTNALITELTFPTLDIHTRVPAQITLSFSPESARTNATLPTTKIGTKQKPWLCSNFRLRISGAEESSAQVTRIESLILTQEINPDQIGIFREPTQTGVKPLDVPSLVLYCPEEFAGQFVDWHYNALVNGHHLEADERSGSLEFLAPDNKTAYFTLQFLNLGIFACALENEEAKTSATRRMKVEIYCEAMAFGTGGLD